MRNLQPRPIDAGVPEEEEVEVDRSRASARNARPVAAERELDLEQRVEQRGGREAGLQLHDAVEEARLVCDPDWCGVAKARDGEHRRAGKRAQLVDRAVQQLLSVAEVRADADECARHPSDTSLGYASALARTALLLPILALILATPAQAADGTALVQARNGAAPVFRAAGGDQLAPQLRLWRVPGDAVPKLRHAGVVFHAEPERMLVGNTAALDEPLAGGEWWRAAIGADAVQPPGPGKPVTIVDSGLDITHEEFASRPDTTLLNEQTTFLEDDDHGTEVASIVGAPVNGLGLAGVYPQAALRSWDASPFGFISTGDAVRGIVEAADKGPGVINLSFGGPDDDPLLHQAVLYAFRRGSLVVASSGNDGLIGNPLSYPAAYPHVLTVGATDETDAVAVFSSQSTSIDLVAPGRHIQVAEPLADDPSGYIVASGTSFSAPMVAGAAAWVWTVHPELDNTQLFDLMRFSAHDLEPKGVDRASGFGMLNIPSALAFPPPVRDPLEPNDEIDQVSPKGMFTGGQPAITTAKRRSTTLGARVDRHEDPRDVYRAFVPAHGSLTARTSAGAIDLRIFRPGARSVSAKPAGESALKGLQADTVTVRNATGGGVYMYIEVRPEASIIRTSYALRVTASARR